MIFVVSLFLVVSGLFFTYVAVGLVRTNERRRGERLCDEQLEVLRRQIRRVRGV